MATFAKFAITISRRETSHKPMITAVANAVYDATGERLRRAPFRKERVREALRAAGTNT